MDGYIYTTTAFLIKGKRNTPDCRIHAWYSTEELARKAAANDWGGMYECLYNYLVIEKVPEGALPLSEIVARYKYVHGQGWIEINEFPPELDGICNFSLG